VKNFNVKTDSLPGTEGLCASAFFFNAVECAREPPKLVPQFLKLFPLALD
jgi:hypothetical protein